MLSVLIRIVLILSVAGAIALTYHVKITKQDYEIYSTPSGIPDIDDEESTEQ